MAGVMKFDPTLTFGNLLEICIFLTVVAKAYGDFRVLNERLNILWKDYCSRHNIPNDKNGG